MTEDDRQPAPATEQEWPRDASSRRRAKKVGADVREVTDKDWQRLCKRYNYCCGWCGRRLKLTQDHIIPLDKGGRHSIGNLIPACRRCNAQKSNKLPVYWRKQDLLQRKRARQGLLNRWPAPDPTLLHITRCKGRYALAYQEDGVMKHVSHYTNYYDCASDWKHVKGVINELQNL